MKEGKQLKMPTGDTWSCEAFWELTKCISVLTIDKERRHRTQVHVSDWSKVAPPQILSGHMCGGSSCSSIRKTQRQKASRSLFRFLLHRTESYVSSWRKSWHHGDLKRHTVTQHRPPQKMVITGLWFRVNSEWYELRLHLDYFPAVYLEQVICS